jgi:D-alanine--poly(phosphoribitol) ligase subunit 2
MANIDQQIIDLLVDITGEDEIGDYRDDDLFEEGVLDSLGAIELLVSLKEEFGVSIAPTELEREEMNTVNKIIARVEERL